MILRRLLRRRLLLVTAGGIVLALMAAGLLYRPAVRVLAGFLSVAAGDTTCSFAQILEGEKFRARTERLAARLDGEIRQVDGVLGLRRWQTPQGAFWTPKRMARSQLTDLLAEQAADLYGKDSVRPGDIVLDCGANIGAFTRKALDAGAALVVAIEPSPDILKSLERTFADEIRLGRVIICPKGVWDKEDVLILHDSGNALGDSFVADYGLRIRREHRAPLTTIDNLVAELKLPRVDVIKMDIEGAERRAIAGAANTIRTFRPRLTIAAEHLADDPVVLPQLVRGLWPDYSVECGPCYRMSHHRKIAPDVLYFR